MLRVLLNDDIKALEREFGRISDKTNNDVEIIAHFFILVAHLLGWSHSDGNLYRTPVFYQTKTQEEADLSKLCHRNRPQGLYEAYKRRQIIKDLLAEGENYSSVALVMGMSVANVKHLEKADHIDKWYREGFNESR